ncbi:MAG: mechanosensitive ion channel family protein, partial [Metallosphaera sp.]
MSYTRPLIRVLILLVILGIIAYVVHTLLIAFVSSKSNLAPYLNDIQLGLDAAIVGIVGYIMIRIIKYALDNYLASKADKTTV